MRLDEHSTWRDVLRFAAQQGDREWVYIITGRPGPTGKTFLYEQLKKNWYNAIEISEDIFDLVDYRDDKNHYLIDYAKKQVVIVLNKPIDLNGKPLDIHGGFVKIGSDLPWREDKFQELYSEWIKKNPYTDISTLYPKAHFIFPGRTNDKTLFTKAWLNAMYRVPMYSIDKVIFNDPATIIFWTDGTKTVVKSDNEAYDPEKGMAMAIAKKAIGNKGNYYNTFKKWLPEDARPVHKIGKVEVTVSVNPTEVNKHSAIEKAYDILVNYRDGDGSCFDIDEVIGYLGEALDD